MLGWATKCLGRGSWVDPALPSAHVCLLDSLFPLLLRGSLSNPLSGSGFSPGSLCRFFFLILLIWVLVAFSAGLTHVSLSSAPLAPLASPPRGLQNVPHKTSLPEGIRVGTVMRIRGVVPEKAGR